MWAQKSMLLAFFRGYGIYYWCVSKTNNRGHSNVGEESPGFIGQDAR